MLFAVPVASIAFNILAAGFTSASAHFRDVFDISARAQENFPERSDPWYFRRVGDLAALSPPSRVHRRSLGLVRLMGMLCRRSKLKLGIGAVIVPGLAEAGHQGQSEYSCLLFGNNDHLSLRARCRSANFVAVNTYMMQLMWRYSRLGWVINIFQRGTHP